MIVRREYNRIFHPVGWTALGLALLAACKGPTVNLSTNDPIKVDINMRLDVYQYGTSGANATASPSPGASPGTATGSGAESRRRNRMADIQKFKNERLIGEGRSGLVVIMKDTLPEGEYGDYVRRAVERENQDRTELMKINADTQKTSLVEIQKQQAELWRNRSFKGEWIEVEVEPGNWQWKQKEG